MQFPDISQNYFELFGLNPGFDLDLGKLHVDQQQLQSRYHPDRFVSASDADKRSSIQLASWINQAYVTLKDPVKRSRYLLELCGVELPDDSQTTSDTAFLMEQIELREQIDGCRTAQNGLLKSEEIETQLQLRANELAQGFAHQYGQEDFNLAQQTSQKMQFVQRLQQQLSDLQFELEDA